MPFYLPNGTKKQHPIMFQSSRHLYYENKDFQAISLPYGESSLSMYIFLPREKVGLEKFYRTLNEKNWKKWMQKFASCKVNLGLPKFKTEHIFCQSTDIQIDRSTLRLRDRIPFRYAIKLRYASVNALPLTNSLFILISTYAERITYLKNTRKFLHNQPPYISYISRLLTNGQEMPVCTQIIPIFPPK
ncbi:MAG: hypothetical protein F6K01_02420 [Okeania sp. SIO1I7]|nr:hypothetical protein [Okeania sp. SIO1I7]